jgi:hypothetical protein
VISRNRSRSCDSVFGEMWASGQSGGAAARFSIASMASCGLNPRSSFGWGQSERRIGIRANPPGPLEPCARGLFRCPGDGDLFLWAVYCSGPPVTVAIGRPQIERISGWRRGIVQAGDDRPGVFFEGGQHFSLGRALEFGDVISNGRRRQLRTLQSLPDPRLHRSPPSGA